MAVRLKLGDYQTVQDDPLGRGYIGCFPRMTESEAWQAGRGVWRMRTDKASRQRFAVIVGAGVVLAVGEITNLTVHGDRVALDGEVLTKGHPVRDAYLGRPDPADTNSHNPVAYCDLPEEQQFLLRPCGCGCGESGDRDFKPGHEIRAINDRIRAHFDGSALKFVQWVDAVLESSAAAGGKDTV
ncbi:hypothetical protein [Actinokineospora enzanensis]|uniref:hypothetical protein n=1 Tax=Actinokineospora enzanensis TaxID=155975 RepID=UPI00036293E8|nr:hypothetical protein [Actinokineospora enzanensis]